jgi:hypothetical protein
MLSAVAADLPTAIVETYVWSVQKHVCSSKMIASATSGIGANIIRIERADGDGSSWPRPSRQQGAFGKLPVTRFTRSEIVVQTSRLAEPVTPAKNARSNSGSNGL